MDDVRCPYCGAWQEINHDDGYGYEEDLIHMQECSKCNMIFIFTTSITFDYYAEKAPCQNDGEHDWKDTIGFPEEYFSGEQRCTICGEKRISGPENKEVLIDGVV